MDWKVLIRSKVLLLILLSTSAKSDDGEKRVVCYYTNWSVYRPGTAKFSPQNINPYLCTHLIYAFGGFTKDNTLKPFDKYQDIDKGGYAKFTGLKTYNKNLKTLIAIGGWNEGSSRFSPMVADSQRRRQFVKNAVKFLRQNHFDGLDLDWEYPAFREGGKPRDRDNYASLVQELREEFEKESSKTGKPRLLLTMAVPAGTEYIDKGYDIPKLDEYLDFINLLSYDYHSAYEPAVNHHSPLYPLEEDNEYNYDNELTIDYTIKHLIKSGASTEKIVLGIPTYGRSYTLFNEDANALGSPADGPGIEGDATREKGYLAYYEICESITNDDWIVEKPNSKYMGPYAFKKNQWVGYDDEDIVREKAKYVNDKKLGGIMFWSIDNDDFRGKCHGRPYPLIEAAKEVLFAEHTKKKVGERQNSLPSRKRNRISDDAKSTSISNSRKFDSSSSRRNTLSRTTPGKRSSTTSKSRNRSNVKRRNEKKPDEQSTEDNIERNENNERTKSSIKSTRSRLLINKNRVNTRANSNTSERDRKKQASEASSTQKAIKNKITTPEPPTTPDPGGDFKCEDEGFFPHPRDCKKYFWCLDSGPSGLGVVANQFTCPSGLVFNKLADSCDYPRNVVCPKVKPKSAITSTSTQRSTTAIDEVFDEEDEEEVAEEDYEDEEEEDVKEVEEEKPKKTTTTNKPLLYKTINRSRPTTISASTATTTFAHSSTTEPTRAVYDISDEEQDPKVIKELIDLIKKAGGIEHLEKQLALQEKSLSNGSNQEMGQVTPATISKTLYERVLNRQNTKNNLFGTPSSRILSSRKTDDIVEEEEQLEEKTNNKPTSTVNFVNGPGRSQFEGLDEVPEIKSLRRTNKPKYITIERHRLNEDNQEEDEVEDEEGEEDNENVASSEEKLISDAPAEKSELIQKSTPGYVNIRRSRTSTTTETSRVDNNIKESDVIDKGDKPNNLIRTSFRPLEYSQTEVTEGIIPKSRYISATNFRSTTNAPHKEIEQTSPPSTSVKSVLTSNVKEHLITGDKSITVAGESGRISVTPFIADTIATDRTFSDDLSSTVRSTIPYTENKIISTHFTTKKIFETTAAPNPNFIEDSVTESLLTVVPTESSTRETVAAVSQPRPFGYPRRTRPTTVSSTISDTTRSTLSGIESTTRPKVLDELILHYPDIKDFTPYKTTKNSISVSPKNITTNSLLIRLDNESELLLKFVLTSPLNPYDTDRIVSVPIRFVDGPADEFYFLQIPEKILNTSGLDSVLKIEVLKPNAKNLEFLNNNDINFLNKSLVFDKLKLPISISDQKLSIGVSLPILQARNNTEYTEYNAFKNESNRNFLFRNNKTLICNFRQINNSLESLSSLNIKNDTIAPEILIGNSTTLNVKHLDADANQSAIYKLQNTMYKVKPTLFFNDKNVNNSELLQNGNTSNKKDKVQRQRIIVYRGSRKRQPTSSSPKRRWTMKKVVRKRIIPVKLKSTDDLEVSGTASMINTFIEVNTSRSPGSSFFRRPGDPPLPRGVYSTIESATKKVYPLQINIENTRVVGIMADQSGHPQNLELILADPPASISSSTDSGKAALIRSNFRRKISTTISPRPIEETPSSTTSSRLISSDRRRQGQKYDSDRIASQNTYHIRARPYKPAVTDYDYYDDEEERFVGKPNGKLLITNRGLIKCLDQGNFPHPGSCKKFITCAKMVNGNVIGTEYTCPDKLSFDPIGGICNWSAGLGCSE